MSKGAAVIDVVANCMEVLRNRNIPCRTKILFDYLRLELAWMLRINTRQSQILGFRVVYQDFELFRYLFRELIITWLYDFRSSRQKPLIIDCGSNIGMSILFFKRLYPNAAIVGVEPDPSTFAILQKNVSQNMLTDVTLYNGAVGDRDGLIDLHINPARPTDLGMSVLERPGFGQTVRVPAIRLSSFIGDEIIDFVKIDVEGAEGEVLSDLSRGKKLSKIRQMVIEYHHRVEEGGEILCSILRELELNRFGYHLKCAAPDFTFFEGGFQGVLIYARNKQFRQ